MILERSSVEAHLKVIGATSLRENPSPQPVLDAIRFGDLNAPADAKSAAPSVSAGELQFASRSLRNAYRR
jgi:hypothetical protein